MLDTSVRQVTFPAGVSFSAPFDHRRDLKTAALAAASLGLVALVVSVFANGDLAAWCVAAGIAGAVSVRLRRPRRRAMWASLTLQDCEILALIEADGGVNAAVRYAQSVASVLDARFCTALNHAGGPGERVVAVALGGPASAIELHDPVGVIALGPDDVPNAVRMLAADGDVEIQVVFAQHPGARPAIAAVTMRSALGELKSADPDALER